MVFAWHDAPWTYAWRFDLDATTARAELVLEGMFDAYLLPELAIGPSPRTLDAATSMSWRSFRSLYEASHGIIAVLSRPIAQVELSFSD